MIMVLLASMAFSATGYYVALAWMSLSIAFFLVCSTAFFCSVLRPEKFNFHKIMKPQKLTA